jgi:acetyl-CoA carboxylase biotin carboxyl carrier protein
MMGIFYSQASPGSPPFVKEGDIVNAGDVVGLIEAMKVFNEITAPCAGRIGALLVKSGALVQPGEPILYVE